LLFHFSNLGSHSLSQRAGRERDEAKKTDKSSSWTIGVISPFDWLWRLSKMTTELRTAGIGLMIFERKKEKQQKRVQTQRLLSTYRPLVFFSLPTTAVSPLPSSSSGPRHSTQFSTTRSASALPSSSSSSGLESITDLPVHFVARLPSLATRRQR
jgi:hypothetical protein